jgi:hypothetical protein
MMKLKNYHGGVWCSKKRTFVWYLLPAENPKLLRWYLTEHWIAYQNCIGARDGVFLRGQHRVQLRALINRIRELEKDPQI